MKWARCSLWVGATLGVLAVPLGLHAQTSLGSTVEGLLQVARANNPEFRGMRFEAEAAAQRVGPAGALPDPKFRVELRDITKMGEQSPTILPGRVGSTRYLLMQDLPWYGKRDLRREVASEQAEAVSAKATGTWRELAAKIKVLYAQLYYLAQNEQLTQEILALMVHLEKIAQVRYSAGLTAQQDVIKAQLEQSAVRVELITLQAERRQLQSRMNALLGRPSAEPLAPPEAMTPLPALDAYSFAALEQRARQRNPLLRAEASQIRSAEKNRDLTHKNRYPDFSVGVSPIQYRGAIKEWELMVELNIPLQQDARRAQERESEAMLATARSRHDAVANQLLAELYENVVGLETAQRTLTLTMESILPQSELTFRSALAGYETGKVDFATLLDAQRQIRQNKLSLIKSGTDAQVRLAEIDRIAGEEQ